MDTDDEDNMVIPFDPLPFNRGHTNANTETPKTFAKKNLAWGFWEKYKVNK